MPLVDINSSLSAREVDYIITRSGIICQTKLKKSRASGLRVHCISLPFLLLFQQDILRHSS